MRYLSFIRYGTWTLVTIALIAFGVFFVDPVLDGPPPPAASIGGPFALTDHTGRAVTEADFAGKPLLVFFGFTQCPDVCPTTLSEISAILVDLGKDADRLQPLFVTVDPERDTIHVLAAYISAFDRRITALTGTAEQVAAMAKAYGVYFRKVPLEGDDYTMNHTATQFIMGADGYFRGAIDFQEARETALAKIRRALD